MTQFFQRVGPRTSAVRQVWLLAALAVAATVLVLWLMVQASSQVRATSENLADTQEAMHKMAVSLDLRLSDVQNEQTGWLSGQPPARDDAAIKLEESLVERFTEVRSAPHLKPILVSLTDLEESVRSLKTLTEACREWHRSWSNTAARLVVVKTNVSALLQRIGGELSHVESGFLSESRTNLQRFLVLPHGPEASEIARTILARHALEERETDVQQQLLNLTLMVERILGEDQNEALTPSMETTLSDACNRLSEALGKFHIEEHSAPDLARMVTNSFPVLRELLFGGKGDGLYALCKQRMELEGVRLDLQRKSADRVGEIRINGVDLQIGFNTLQREASVAASLAMQHTGRNLLWFGVIVGLVFLLLAFRIAGTLRAQLTTIQRNSAELDRAATEAKAAADSLSRSEQRTRLIVDTATDAVISTDERGLITTWNKQAEQTFGWSAWEAIGQTLANLLVPDRLRQSDSEGFHRFLRSGAVEVLNQRIEAPALRKDGSEIPIELTVTPIRYGGQVTFNAFLRDISDRKRAEHEVLRSKERVEAVNTKLQASLETAERLTIEAQAASTAKSEFLATMSHEIRTPMNGIIGFTDLLLDTRLDEEQRDYLFTIKSSADSLLAIINDILDFSKVEAGKMQLESTWFDLNTVAADVTRLLSTQAAAKNLKLAMESDASHLPRVFADSSRVRQVLVNLTGNALKFTQQGSVTVRLTLEPMTQLADVSSKGRVRVSVTDSGIGIPKEKQAQMFGKFVQADSSHSRRYGGTGLGLAICRSLVELMGGTIGFESEPGHGSTFWFTLPCETTVANSAPQPPLPAVPEPSLSRGAGNPAAPGRLESVELPPGIRVLLVEDNRTNQHLASTLLRKMGCQVDIVTNGIECVRIVREQSYSLVLMDCHMPEMGGFEATEEIRRWEAATRATRRLPIIALTASLMDEDKSKCDMAGMDDFLGKPIQVDELIRAIRRWALQSGDSLRSP